MFPPQRHLSPSMNRLESFRSLEGPTLLYGGTFDPVHRGHIEAAELAKTVSASVNVVLIPTHLNPLKAHPPIASDHDRLQMLERAIGERPGFFVSGIECGKGGPVFTIDTVRRIQSENHNLPLRMLIGADQLPTLHLWNEWSALYSSVAIWIVGRSDVQSDAALGRHSDLSPDQIAGLKARFVPFRSDVSSTAIRQALKGGGASTESPDARTILRDALDPEVAKYISERRLYNAQA